MIGLGVMATGAAEAVSALNQAERVPTAHQSPIASGAARRAVDAVGSLVHGSAYGPSLD